MNACLSDILGVPNTSTPLKWGCKYWCPPTTHQTSRGAFSTDNNGAGKVDPNHVAGIPLWKKRFSVCSFFLGGVWGARCMEPFSPKGTIEAFFCLQWGRFLSFHILVPLRKKLLLIVLILCFNQDGFNKFFTSSILTNCDGWLNSTMIQRLSTCTKQLHMKLPLPSMGNFLFQVGFLYVMPERVVVPKNESNIVPSVWLANSDHSAAKMSRNNKCRHLQVLTDSCGL